VNKKKSLRHDGDGKAYLDCVNRLDDFFLGFRVSEIDADLIRKFQVDQQQKKLSNGSINRSVSALRRMFNLALEDGKLRNVAYFPMLREAPPREGWFERKQYDDLLFALPDYLRLPLALGYFCGMRLSEVLSLKWEQIDFLSNTINLRAGTTKNDAGRTIPIVPPLLALIVERHAKRQAACPFACFRLDRRGEAVKIEGFRKAWTSRCVKLGLGRMEPAVDLANPGEVVYAAPRKDRRAAKAKAKLVYRGLIFHDLRRSAVRNLVRAGVSEKIAMNVSGHLTREVFERYNISSEKDVLEPGKKMALFHEKVGDNSGTEVHQDAAVSSVVQ
jgi:integrase